MTDMGGWGEVEGYEPGAVEGGATDDTHPGEHTPNVINLGGGIRLRIHPEWFRMIMHTPEITDAVDARCDALAAEANSLAVREDAEYTYTVSNNPDNIRARGRVKPANFEARLDDAENSTLLKALATVGSDPLPPQYFSGQGEFQRYLEAHADYHAELGTESPPSVGDIGGEDGGEEG